MVISMSETIITALISAVASLFVAFGTWHVSMRVDRQKQTAEVLGKLEADREEYLSGIRGVQDDITGVNATIQTQIALIEQKIDVLSDRVDKHNQVIDRTRELEKAAVLHEEQIKVANHRIEDLEQATK